MYSWATYTYGSLLLNMTKGVSPQCVYVCVFVALLTLVRPSHKVGWNYFLHIGLHMGVSIMVFCYTMELYARKICPLEENILNTFVPRFYSCYWWHKARATKTIYTFFVCVWYFFSWLYLFGIIFGNLVSYGKGSCRCQYKYIIF